MESTVVTAKQQDDDGRSAISAQEAECTDGDARALACTSHKRRAASIESSLAPELSALREGLRIVTRTATKLAALVTPARQSLALGVETQEEITERHSNTSELRMQGDGDVHAYESDSDSRCSRLDTAVVSSDAHPPVPQDLNKSFAAIEQRLQQLSEGVSALLASSNGREALEETIIALSQHNRTLTENVVLHEMVYPPCRCLINVADRIGAHREQLRGDLRHVLAMHNRACEAWLRALLDIAETNLLDVENALAVLGVETYRCGGDSFDPARQQYVGPIPTTDLSLHGRVAQRLSAGRKRGDYIIQAERVHVWVFATNELGPLKGAQPHVGT